MKKLLILIFSVSLFFGTIMVKPIFATSDLDEIYQEEISDSIISGDGSADNSYIINPNSAPMFTKFLDDAGKSALSNVISGNNGITTFGILDGVLSGTAHYNQTKGAYWNYRSGAPSTTSNDNIWIDKIEYICYNDVKEITAGFVSTSAIDTFKGSIASIAAKQFATGVNYLVSKGLKKSLATALVKWVGCSSTYIGSAISLSEINTFIKQKRWAEAYRANKGMIHAVYKTSYQGAWYNHSLLKCGEVIQLLMNQCLIMVLDIIQ